MQYHRKKGTKSSKNPITGTRDFVPVSRNVMFDDKKKLWIQQRKRNYYYWFRCLQFCLKNNEDVRFDFPVIGENTLLNIKRAELNGLALVKNKLITLNKDKLIKIANKLDLFISID